MGRAAKRKKKPTPDLPESWFSPRHGHVQRDDFKGCRIAQWSFELDQPLVLMNDKTNQVHFNLEVFDPEEVMLTFDDYRKATGSDLQIERTEITNF